MLSAVDYLLFGQQKGAIMASKLEVYKKIKEELELQLGRAELDLRWMNMRLIAAGKDSSVLNVINQAIAERKEMIKQYQERLEILNVTRPT